MSSNSLLLFIKSVIGIGVAFALIVLAAYAYYLGPISRVPGDWGVFGSVLAGAFTFLSSFATIGTLLFLYLQQLKNEERQTRQDEDNRKKQLKHDEVVEKQISAMTFEQYINHRKLFIERLNEQAEFFKNVIVFPNPERVYNKIFSKNNPSYCEFKVVLNKDQVVPHDLTDCIEIYSSIERLLDNISDKEGHLTLIKKIFHLQDCLGIEYTAPARDGDILFVGMNAGFNIYGLGECLRQIEHVLNSILFYSGNEKVGSITHKVHLIRDYLYQTITEYYRAKGGVQIHYNNPALVDFHKIYEASQMHFVVTERILEKTYFDLSDLLSNSEQVKKIEDFDFVRQLTGSIQRNLNEATNTYENDQNALAKLGQIEIYLSDAKKKLGLIA